ncbi:glycosyl hydrolase family 95 catalytic domain-containing protein [Mediterraneibacter agrestimuris]|uniref:glycosyl hydrolase family 95 catalytic domain-containing protein n=1 Tax=Mediterraneibacter agrestimuris TaxID=2941333 RepID=UPI00203A9D49|nr:hypothetical protein [Mediterraneibacter agrestimuris]
MTEKKLPGENCNLLFFRTVQRWDEAVPLGNGQCGALIWGTSRHLRFSLDRGDIWDVTTCPGIEKKEFSYKNMIRLVRERNEEEIRHIFDEPYNHVLPSKLPAGKIIFDFQCDENVCSKLILSHAEAKIQMKDILVCSFLHAEENIGYIAINKPADSFSFQIENPEYSIKTEGQPIEDVLADSVNTTSLKKLYYKTPQRIVQEGIRGFTQEISDIFSYGIFLRFKESCGKTYIVYSVANSNDGSDWKEKTLEKLEKFLDKGYQKTFCEHCGWWKSYWEKSSVTLPDKEFEKNWYLTNYLLASCSRKGHYPMPLQGVWTADDGKLPPWKGDYHHDLNTQMSYYSYLKANHLEEGECFIDYLWSMAECGRQFSKKFYNSKGICIPAVMSIDGKPLGGWGMYALSPANQLWLCQAFERYYRFSGDKKFLEEEAYPYLSETAEFIMGILEERDGLYYLPISSSPEIHDDTIEAFLTPNSNYDVSLMRYLFGALGKLADELDNGETEKWNAILLKIPELAVNEKNVLMLSPDESLEESHRHMSHAMAIHPLRLLNYEKPEEKKIIDATILDLERLGTGYWVGYSFTWLAEFYTIQKNGNGAAYQLRTFWESCCSPNGFHLNGDYKNHGISTFHYRPFTLEGNFCAADVLQEMLLQSENNILEFFPAIPEEWCKEEVAFENFRAERGMLVSAAMNNGKIISVMLAPKYDGKIYIRKSRNVAGLFGDRACEVEKGMLEVELEGGRKYIFGIDSNDNDGDEEANRGNISIT